MTRRRASGPRTRSVGWLGACLALLLSSTWTACSPCREICREYESTLGRASERISMSPGVGLDDHLAISIAEPVLALAAERLADELANRLRGALPAQVRLPLVEIPVRTHVEANLTTLRLVGLRDTVAVDLGMALGISVELEGLAGDAAAGVTGRVTVRAALALEGSGEEAVLVLRLRDSSLRDLTLTPTGVAALGRLGHTVLDAIEEAVRFALQPEILAEIGNLPLVTIRPLLIEGLGVRVSPNSLTYHEATARLRIGLVTDLSFDPLRVRVPRMIDSTADVELLVSAALGQPLLAALLAHDGGRRFDASGRPDPDGPFRVTVTDLTTRRREVAFAYRLYRTSAPCLLADFSGNATVAWVDGAPVAQIERHELTYASRFREAVETSQPPVDALGRRLTQLLANGLSIEAVRLPGGISADLIPDGLSIARVGYRVGWRVVPSGARAKRATCRLP